MPRDKKWTRLLTWGSKALVLGVLLVAVFSPFGQTFSISTAQAAECPEGSYANFFTYIVAGENHGGYNCRDNETGAIVGTLDQEGNYTPQDPICNSFGSCIANIVYIFTVGLGSGVAYLGAWVLSMAIALSLSSTAYALTFLTEGWTIVRDIANMLFILILVYIAFTVMFRAETSDTMKRLAWVVVIALVINFSFFFVRVVIDAGNLLAVQFYNAIEAEPLGVTSTASRTGFQDDLAGASAFTGAGSATKDLTSSIMDGIGVQKIISAESFKNFQEDSNWLTELIALSFIYIALGAILFILAAMFFTVGIKFIVRIVVLWLVLIVSPLALIARTVQQGRKYYDQWQDALILHAFYPAVFLFIFYVLTLFMSELATCTTATGATQTSIIACTFEDLNQDQTQGLLYIVPLIAIIAIKMGFVIALVYIGLKASEAMGVAGANFARTATGKVFGAGFGTLGFAGRNIIGARGQAIAQSGWTRNLASQKGVKGLLGGGILRTGSFLGGRTFDPRGLRATQAGAGTLGLNIGKPREGGYMDSFKKRVERQTKFADNLEPNEAQLEQARKQALKEMTPADRDRLALAAKTYNEQLELQKVGGADRNDVKQARKNYTDALKQIEIGGVKFGDRVKQIAGADNKKSFAATLETRSLRNLWGVASSGRPGVISKADHEAAVKIRGVKKEEDAKHLQQLLKNVYGLDPTVPERVAAPLTRSALTRTVERSGSLNNATEKLKGEIEKKIATPQSQMVSSIPAQQSSGPGQFGGSASRSEPSRAFEGRPGMTEEQYNKGVAALNKTITEQGKLTRDIIAKGAHEQAAVAREGLKLGGEKLGEVVREIKKGDIKAEGRSKEQLEEARRGTEATAQVAEKAAEQPKNTPPKPPVESPKPEDKK